MTGGIRVRPTEDVQRLCPCGGICRPGLSLQGSPRLDAQGGTCSVNGPSTQCLVLCWGHTCSPCPPERLPLTSSGGSRQGLYVRRGAKCLRWGVTGRLSKGNLGLYVFVRLRGGLSGEVFCGLLLLVYFEVTDAGIRL